MISAKVVGDSMSPHYHRITSMLVTMPRIILAELNTHRMLSKNSASSRAIPYKKMLKNVIENPFIPIAFQRDHKGMQGVEYLDANKVYTFEEIRNVLHNTLIENFKDEDGEWIEPYDVIDKAINFHVLPLLKTTDLDNGITLTAWWLKCRDLCIASSIILNSMGVTKQLCNRLLEPFMWHTVLITSTEWENFFKLRCPQYEIEGELFRSWKDLGKSNNPNTQDLHIRHENDTLLKLKFNLGQAEIHMMALAEAMWDAMNESTPVQLEAGDWHIVFNDKIDELVASTGEQIYEPLARVKVATGMAARTSYTVVGNEKEVSCKTLIGIHDKMVVANPFHASPFEHCAQAMTGTEYYHSGINIPASINAPNQHANFSNYGWCRNFKGWIPYRAILEQSK